MDFVPSSLANPSTLVGSTLSGVTIVASTASGMTIVGGTISGSTLVGVTLTGSTFIGGTLSGTSLVSVSVNSGSTISVYALPTRQYVHVDRNGSDQTISNNSYTQVNYTNEVSDTAGVFSTSTDRMTPTVAGKYLVVASVGYESMADDDLIESHIYKNGSSVRQSGSNSTDNGNITNCCVAYVEMNGSTDYLEHFTRQTNGGAASRDLSGDTDKTFFQAMWMST